MLCHTRVSCVVLEVPLLGGSQTAFLSGDPSPSHLQMLHELLPTLHRPLEKVCLPLLAEEHPVVRILCIQLLL